MGQVSRGEEFSASLNAYQTVQFDEPDLEVRYDLVSQPSVLHG